MQNRSKSIRIAYPLSLTLLIAFTLWSLTYQPTQAAGTIYVNKNVTGGASNGSSWANAYPDLQMALANATAGSEIWVAQGIYTPGTAVTDTFQLIDEVSIYGGFAATETIRTQRDWENNITVLSGDIDGNDITDADGVVTATTGLTETIGESYFYLPLNPDDPNSYNVVTGSGVTHTAVLDGFTITAGKAYLPDDGTDSGEEPESAQEGAGIYIINGHPTLSNLRIIGNYALIGGGLANNEQSHPKMTNITFSQNYALFGGGMSNTAGSHPTLNKVSFINNSSVNGGGILNYEARLRIENSLFQGNHAGFGGAIQNTESDMTLINSVIDGNFSEDSGGGLVNFLNSDSLLVNVSLANNRSLKEGGGVANFDNSNPTIINSIIWNNTDINGTGTITSAIYNAPKGTDVMTASIPAIANSVVEGSGGSSSWNSLAGTDGGNNIDTNPLFFIAIDPATAPTTLGDLRLQSSSPAINAGQTSSYLSYTHPALQIFDLAGNYRIWQGQIDMGAYEFITGTNTLSNSLISVQTAGTGTGAITPLSDIANAGPEDTAFVHATADANSVFIDWVATDEFGNTIDYGCYPLDPGPDYDYAVCTVTLDPSPVTITARFELKTDLLIITTTGSGSGSLVQSPNLPGSTQDTSTTVAATADADSVFLGWTPTKANSGTFVDYGCSQITYEIHPSETVCETSFKDDPVLLTARFELKSDLVIITSTGSGSGSLVQSPNLPGSTLDTTTTVTATADTGSTFTGWLGDCANNPAPSSTLCQISFGSESKHVTATFKLNSYPLTTAVNGTGSGSLSRSPDTISYTHGTTVTLTATPAADSNFTGWSGACAANAHSNGDCIVTIDAAQHVTATFDLKELYPLTTQTDGNGQGSIGRTPYSTAYSDGTVVTLTASAALGSTFTGWSGDCATNANSCTLSIDAAKSVTATFELNSYPLSTQVAGSGSGSISRSPNAISYTHGTTVTLVATADSDSSFIGWSGDCVTNANSCSLSIDAAKAVTATFKRIEMFDLTVVKAGSGTVTQSISGSTFVTGTQVTLTATADAGHEFAGWSGDCVGTADCLLTFDSHKVITATFKEKEKDIVEPVFPTQPLKQPPNGSTVPADKLTFDWSDAFDNESAIESYTLLVTITLPTRDSGNVVTYTFTTTESSFTPSVQLPAGEVEWTVLARDVAGNVTPAAESFRFTLAQTPDTPAGYKIFLPTVVR